MQRLVAAAAAVLLVSGWMALAEPAESAATSAFEKSRDAGGPHANSPASTGASTGVGDLAVRFARALTSDRDREHREPADRALVQAPKTSPPAAR